VDSLTFGYLFRKSSNTRESAPGHPTKDLLLAIVNAVDL